MRHVPRRGTATMASAALVAALATGACATDVTGTSTDPVAVEPDAVEPTTDEPTTVDDASDEPAPATDAPAPAPAEAELSDDRIDGLSFTLPEGKSWSFAARGSQEDPFMASLDGSFATSITVTRSVDTIDAWLAAQEAFYAEEGYEVPDPWWFEVAVPGADRAVQVDWQSGSGDGAIQTRLVQSGDNLYEVEVYRYIEDLELLTSEEVDTFLASITTP